MRGRQKKPREEPVAQKTIGNAKDLMDLFPAKSFGSYWDTPEAFSRYVRGLDKNKSWHGSAWEESGHRDEFTGTRSMSEALDLAENGWKEGAEKIEETRRYIQALNPRAPRLQKFGIAGAFPNVPRAVAGNIFNMYQHEEGKARKKTTITLVADMTAHCGVPEMCITNRSATVAAIVDEIEASGYACEVVAYAGTVGYTGFTAATMVRVKESTQPLDVVRMAFPMGHVAMWRRLIFADWQSENLCKDNLGYGLGCCGEIKIVPEYAEKNVYILPSAGEKYQLFKTDKTSATKGLSFLVDRLAKQGCPAFSDGKRFVEQE